MAKYAAFLVNFSIFAVQFRGVARSRQGRDRHGSVSRLRRDGRMKLWNLWFTYCSVGKWEGIMPDRRTIFKND